jgi:rhodanese-related sulfurtransferase
VTKKYPSTKKHSTSKKAPSRRKEAAPRSIPWFYVSMVGLIVVVMGVLIAYRIGGTQTLPAEVSVDRVHRAYNQGAFILDVREQFEWDEYHIPNATLIPLGELASRTAELPTDQEIYIVCRSGNRSQEGRDILRAAGFNRVTSMAGGMLDWRAKNFPIETGN